MKKMIMFGLVLSSLIGSSSFAETQKMVEFYSRLDNCVADLDLIDSSGNKHPTIVLYGKNYGGKQPDGPTDRPISHTFKLTGLVEGADGLNYIEKLTIHQENQEEVESKGETYLTPQFFLPDLIVDKDTNPHLFALINKTIDEEEKPFFIIGKKAGKIDIISRSHLRFPFNLLWWW